MKKSFIPFNLSKRFLYILGSLYLYLLLLFHPAKNGSYGIVLIDQGMEDQNSRNPQQNQGAALHEIRRKAACNPTEGRYVISPPGLYVIKASALHVIKPPVKHAARALITYAYGDDIHRVSAVITYQPAKAAWIKKGRVAK